MKNVTVFFISLALLFITACTQQADSNIEAKKDLTFEVMGVHEIELKPEVNEKEFETFVIDKIIPLYQKLEGQDGYLVKGDRGNRTGKYSLVITFDSTETRDRIYPDSGELSEEFQRVYEASESLWTKLDTYAVEGVAAKFTDYEKIAH